MPCSTAAASYRTPASRCQSDTHLLRSSFTMFDKISQAAWNKLKINNGPPMQLLLQQSRREASSFFNWRGRPAGIRIYGLLPSLDPVYVGEQAMTMDMRAIRSDLATAYKSFLDFQYRTRFRL